MSWRYQAKRVDADFEDGYEYTVVEAFPSLQREVTDVVPHTDATKFFAETPQGLAELLRLAADDVEKYDVIIWDDE
ncbi:MAG: hypothetical protein ACSHWR_08625 [Psychromonas sp.]